ncbi:hypothetical protein BBJ28_00001218 [Nothophytophthora sp. Chile5]|nr:hypothetical protein BBJ28_00001218 [Nothophytophthora sp. Chile5]
MCIINSQADLQGITIENGSASEAGGGIAIIDSIVELSNVSIRANDAQNGGGVMTRDSHVSCTGPVFVTENHAVDGGAIWVNTSTMAGGVEGLNCLSNTASRYGGGLFVVETASLENVKLESNQAPNGGGAYVLGATLILAGVDISECSATIAGGGMLMIDSHVTASEVSLSSGSAPDGGGIYAFSSTISGDMMIDSCSGTDHGGGIYLTSVSNVVGVSVDNCTATEGGAVYVVDGSVHMESTRLTASFALQRGGGLCVANSSVQLEDTYLGEDHSGIMGGGAFLEDSTIMHRNISVVSCYASEGGGVYLEESAFVAVSTSSQSQITGNQALAAGGNVFLSSNCSLEQLNITSGGADSGGGIAVNSGTATIRNCSAVNNAAAFGGGIDVKSGSVCVLIDCVIAMNTADETGGGIAIADAILLHDGMSVVSNTAPLGAGMFATGVIQLTKRYEGSPQAWFQANNATDSASTKGYGGSLYIAPASSVNVSGLDMLDGGAYRGAGVYVDGGILSLTNSLIQNCSASSGGGMYANYDSSLELRNCTLQTNFASQSGGAIGSSGSQSGLPNALVLEDCYLFNNSAHVYGGAIMLALTDLSGTGNMLVANSALIGAGGAIALLSKGIVTLDNWKLHNNTLGDEYFVQGGSIYLTGGAQVNISDSVLISNEEATLVRNGGLIYVEDATTILIITNTLLGFGQSYSGGLIYSVDSAVYIRNCTLHRGYAYDTGAGIFAINSRFEITNSVFYDNFAYYDGGGMFVKDGGEMVIRNSLFDLNTVEAQGGAIAINPGADVTCIVSDSNFTRNTNIGFGSTVFVGRENTVQLTNCKISGNGGSTTEGGALYAVDATVSIENSVFELNSAVNGAAIQVAREANLTVKSSIIRNNSANAQGGAFYASVRAIATFIDSLIEANDAGEGGAMYTMGSASITLTNVSLSENTAMNFGGAISMRGSSKLLVKGSDLENNAAYTGGAISVQENASLSITTSNFRYNDALDFGAAIYVDKESEAESRSVNCATSTFGGNTATAGIDIYWVYYPSFVFDCDQCSALTGSDEVAITTSAMTITPGWWPSSVTSGVSLGISIPDTSTSGATDTSSLSASTRRLTSSASSSSQDSTSALLANLTDSMLNPDAAVLWPTVVVRDYYGTIAHHDNATRCQASVANDENDTFVFSPSNWILVTNGYITFTNAEVRSTSRDLPYQLDVSCSLSQETQQPHLTVNITVEMCKPGYQSINGLRTKRTLHLFQITLRPRPVPGWRPEKFKIMLGFFQVFGGFKEIYEIPWPNKMSRLMDLCSMVDFNFVDVTASECLFRPPTIARRATIVAKLKTDRKMRAANLHNEDLGWVGQLRAGLQRVLDRVNSSWFMVHTSRLLQYLARLTRLPASLPEHQPACPTSQRISSDVLGMVVHSNLRLWRARIWLRLYFKSFQNKCIKLFFWVLLLFYPMFSQRVLGTFYCDEIGEHYYLSLDRSIVCYEGIWLFYLPMSIAFIIVWVIGTRPNVEFLSSRVSAMSDISFNRLFFLFATLAGVPLLFWLILLRKRRQGVSDTLLLIQDPSQDYLKQRLLDDMRLDRVDRGLVLDEEKLQLFESEMIAQFLSDKNLNVGSVPYTLIALWVCELTKCSLPRGLILKMGSLYLEDAVVSLVTNTAIITNVATLVYAVYSIVDEKVTARRIALRHTRDDHRRAIQAHVCKLWRKAYAYALTEVYLSDPDRGPMSLLVIVELARRNKHEQEIAALNAQVDLTSAVEPSNPHHDSIVSASHVDVLDGDGTEGNEPAVNT